MGGKQVKNESGSLMSVPDKKGLAGMEYELPPPGSRGGADDIAAPVQSAEESLRDMIVAENKKNIANMRKRKMLEEAIDDASPGFSGDRKVDAELVAENLAERMGLVYDDLPTKERIKLYDEAYQGISKKKFDPPEEKADGGRIGFKGGLSKLLKEFMERRKFLKTMVGNTEKNKRARELEMLKETMEKARENPGFEFPSGKELRTEIEKKIGPILLKDRKLNADGGRIGFFMGSPFPKGLATLREMLKFFSKGKEKERPGSEVLRLVNPKAFNKFLEDPNIYKKFDVEKGIGAPELIKNMQADMAKNRTMMVEEILSAAKNIRKADIGTMERKKEIVAEMMRKGIDRETAEDMADTLSKMAESAAGKLDTPKLTDEGILQLENILKNMETGGKDKRSLNADGGRIGFKDGMTRRTFLKIFAGLASIPIIGKIVRPLKTVKGVKNVPIIKTADVPGKPEWFDQLVNKVILEGDDVTKKFATQERQVVHMKKIDDETSVTVTQDLNDGSIMVDVDDPIRNVMGESGDDTSVQMLLKKNPGDESSPAGADEFSFTENDMRNYMDGPDDYTTEFTENTVNKMKDLTSDLGKIESYATGKKQTMKQIVESKKRKDKVRFAEEKPAEYAAERGPDIDYSDYEYASGGIARMLGE